MTPYRMNLILVSMLAVGCGNATNVPPKSKFDTPAPVATVAPDLPVVPQVDIIALEDLIIPLCNAKHANAEARENCLNNTIEQLLITFHREDLIVPAEEGEE